MKILSLSLKNIFRNKKRTILTLFTISLGFSMLGLSFGYINYVKWGLRESTIYSQTGHFQVVNKKSLKEEEEQTILQYGVTNYRKMIGEIEKIDEVNVALPRINFTGLVATDYKSNAILVSAVNPEKEIILGNTFINEKPYEILSNEPDGIILGDKLAKSLNLKQGDYITLMTTTTEGALNAMDFKFIGTMSLASSELSKRFAMIWINKAFDLLRTNKVGKIVIGLYDTEDMEIANKKLNKILSKDLKLIPWYDLALYYKKVLSFFYQIVSVLTIILMIIVFFSSMNTILMSILERRREFATLRAIGTTKLEVFKLLVAEGVWLSIIGIAFGILFEYVASIVINNANIMMPPPPGSARGYTLMVRLLFDNNLFLAVISFSVVIFSCMVPSLKVFKENIAIALRSE